MGGLRDWGCWIAAAVLLTAGGTSQGAVTAVGHRGDSMFAPENTTAALIAAAGHADWVEIDIQKSSDGAMVVIHDATVNRTTNGTGSVVSMTLAQLQALDAGVKYDASFAGQRLPTLAEAFSAAWSNGLYLLIERKSGDISAADLNSALIALGATDKVVVQSFDWNFCAAIKALNPSLRVGVLGSGTLTAAQITTAKNTNMEFIAWEQAGVTAATIADIHAAGMKQFVWTVDGVKIQTFYDLGVDGIITNDPGTAKDVAGVPYTPGALNTDLVSYWKLDDGLTSGTPAIAADSRGPNNGSVLGSPSWVNGADAVAGGAVQLNGTNSCAVIPSSPTMDVGTKAMSVSLWVKLDQLPSEQTVSFAGVFDALEDSYVIYCDKASGELRAKFSAGPLPAGPFQAARPGIPASALEKANWHHVAIAYNGSYAPLAGACRIFLDGKLMDVHPGNDGTSPAKGMNGFVKPGQTTAIGRNGSDPTGYFRGKVDEVALWKRDLTQTEVRAIYVAGVAGQPLESMLGPSAVADWSVY